MEHFLDSKFSYVAEQKKILTSLLELLQPSKKELPSLARIWSRKSNFVSGNFDVTWSAKKSAEAQWQKNQADLKHRNDINAVMQLFKYPAPLVITTENVTEQKNFSHDIELISLKLRPLYQELIQRNNLFSKKELEKFQSMIITTKEIRTEEIQKRLLSGFKRIIESALQKDSLL